MTIRKKSLLYISLIMIIFVQMGMMVYFGTKKTDFHEDEYYTYGLSNDQGTGFLQIPDRTWQGPALFADYLTVNENHRFDYPNVWKNQGNDVHPPLYYVFIHTLCSFTPNVMSKWIGISFNLLMFVLCMGVLFGTAKKLTKSDLAAWLSCVMFGFSIGAVSAVIFIRMYMLFTLWVLCAMYLIIWQLERRRCDRRFYLLLYGITVLGVMTQYYFLIFMFFLSAAFCILLMYQKRWKEFAGYVLSMAAAGVSCIVIFPSMLNHIFFGYRGTEAITNVKNTSGILNELVQMIATVNNELFGGYLLGLLVILLICLGILFVLKSKNYKFSMILTKAWLFTFLPCFGYFLVVTKVAPFKTDRYIFPIFPLIVLLFITISCTVVNLLVENKKIAAGILGTLVFILTVVGFTTQKVNYIYEDRQIRHDVTKANKGLNTVYITDGEGWKVIGSCTELMNTDKVYYVDGTNKEPVTDEELNRAEELLIYVDSGFQAEEIIKKLFQNNKYLKNYELLYEGFYSKVYRVY
ncbi:glycosyltransferase family 39 protein [Anaerosacchariphilus polymeriproducens]|uniref:ArnT-like N-terminal domain-containing protein n=1 Tax=Anaerosacchariphilus polymeriproducens TaxID=1812858 RepID=A0A371AXY2_9FIRM|nr:phospholipid carrier-dependent glycosyltransferase [Anaerosacchariphilus polymeriproducens]RDU24436.1 hypothetical protein DWV06_02870 [Anaerosacchariphilus polymeriproducens]